MNQNQCTNLCDCNKDHPAYIKLFSLKDANIFYELKYYFNRCELILTVDNRCQNRCENIVICKTQNYPVICQPKKENFCFLGCFNPASIYTYNNVVRVENDCCQSLYIYNSDNPSAKYAPDYPIDKIPGWNLMIKCYKNQKERTNPIEENNYQDLYKKLTENIHVNLDIEERKNSNKKTRFENPDSKYICYESVWEKDKVYGENSIVKHKENVYIAIKKNNDHPSKKTSWELLFRKGINYLGTWKEGRKYRKLDMVKMGNDVCICKKNTDSGHFVEEDWVFLWKEEKKPEDPISDFIGEKMVFPDNDKFFYAVQLTDFVYPIGQTKKKIRLPIIFTSRLKNSNIQQDNEKIIFSKTGLYRMTLHFTYTGCHYLKTISYLFGPPDHPTTTEPSNNCKIGSSQMGLTSSIKKKNYLHYQYITKISDSLSTLIIFLVYQPEHLLNFTEEKNLCLYGSDKSWLSIEKLD